MFAKSISLRLTLSILRIIRLRITQQALQRDHGRFQRQHGRPSVFQDVQADGALQSADTKGIVSQKGRQDYERSPFDTLTL